MPTKRGNVVRHLLKRGEAKVIRYEPFTVMILCEVGHCVQAVTLGVDVGSKHIGLCASTKAKELYSAQVELRDDVSELLTARREFRRGRRGRMHNWYRPARWQNRANEEGNAALPPSIRHKADSHIRAIRFVCKLLPVVRIRLEIGKFDSQKIANPGIQGEQYQQGTLAGWENLKAYAKWRDGYKCRVCGASSRKDPNVKLEVHHINRRADGGTDTPDNVVTLCHDCHEAHHKGERKLKLKRPPQHKGEAHMNAMKDYLVDTLMHYPWRKVVEVTYGYITAMRRREQGIEKSHANDAFCIAGNFEAERNLANVYEHHFVRRHQRSLHQATVISPAKVSRAVQEKMPPKMKRFGFRQSAASPKINFGFRRNDIVVYKGCIHTITGFSGKNAYLFRHFDLTQIRDEKGHQKKIGLGHIRRVSGVYGLWTARKAVGEEPMHLTIG